MLLGIGMYPEVKIHVNGEKTHPGVCPQEALVPGGQLETFTQGAIIKTGSLVL